MTTPGLEERAKAVRTEATAPPGRTLFRALALGVGPAILAITLVQVLLVPGWASGMVAFLAASMAASFVAGDRLARSGRSPVAGAIVTSAALLVATATLFTRSDGLGPALAVYLTIVVGTWVMWPERMSWAVGFCLAAVLAEEGLTALGVLHRLEPSPLAQYILQAGFTVALLPVVVLLIRIAQRVNEKPIRLQKEAVEERRTLLEAVSRTQPAVEDLVNWVEKLSAALASQAQEQAAALEQVTGSAEQLQAMIAEAVEAAHGTRRIAERTRESSLKSRQRLSSVEEELNHFFSVLESVRVTVERQSQQSLRIEQILEYVQEVDEQMNVLALNAALEAAHAGEAGKEFGVVASELGGMISGTAEVVKQGGELLETIRSEGKQTVERIQTGADQLKKYLEELRTAGTLIRQIVDHHAETSKQIDLIAAGADRQQEQVLQLAAAMHQLRDAAQQLMNLADDLSGSIQRIASSQFELTTLVQSHPAKRPAAPEPPTAV